MSNADLDPKPHQIRLRAAWEHARLDSRVDLPVDWPLDLDTPFQISRRFGRPTFDPASETVFLRLEAVPGLVQATLNDVDLVTCAPLSPKTDSILLIPVNLQPKNLLTLTIDPSFWSSRPESAHDWGIVSLSIEAISSQTSRLGLTLRVRSTARD